MSELSWSEVFVSHDDLLTLKSDTPAKQIAETNGMSRSTESNSIYKDLIFIAIAALAFCGIGLLVFRFSDSIMATVIAVAICILVSGIFFAFHPRFRFFRIACHVLALWSSCRLIPAVALKLEASGIGPSNISFDADSSTSVPVLFDVTCAVVVITCLLIDSEIRDRFLSKLPSLRGFRLPRLFNLNVQAASNNSAQVNINGSNNTTHINTRPTEGELDAEIDKACELMKNDKISQAIDQLEGLRKKRWDLLDSRQKYRVLANLGHSEHRRDSYEEAAKYWVEAYEFQPNDADAQAFKAAASINLKSIEVAHEEANHVLETFPNNEHAWCFKIQTSPEDLRLDDVEASIPPHLSHRIGIRLALHRLAESRDEVEAAVRHAKVAFDDDNSSAQAAVAYGTALARRAVEVDKGKVLRTLEEGRADSELAIKQLSKVIERHDYPSRSLLARARYSRALANDLLGHSNSAEADFVEAVSLSTSDLKGQILFAFGLYYTKKGRHSDAQAKFSEALELKDDAETKLFLSEALSISAEESDQSRASDILADLLKDKNNLDERHLFRAVQCSLELDGAFAVQPEGLDRHLDFAKEYLTGVPLLVMQTGLYLNCDAPSRAKETGKLALEAISNETSPVVRNFLASYLKELGQFKDALNVFRPIVNARSPTELLHFALECARLGGDFKFILSTTSSARREGNASKSMMELEIIALEDLREWEKAVAVIEYCLTRNLDDEFNRLLTLRKSLIALRSGRREWLETRSDHLPCAESCTLYVGARVVIVLRAGADPKRGAEYAYNLLRRHFGTAEAHEVYVYAVGLSDEERPFEIPSFDTVRVGSAVRYEDDDGSSRWAIVEDASDPDGTRGEYHEDSSLARSLLGKKVGDRFELRSNSIQDRFGTITQIVSKLAYRLMDVMEEFERRFPDAGFLQRFNFSKRDDGELDVEEFISTLEKLDEPQKGIDRVAKAFCLPPLEYSTLSRIPILQAMQHLVSDRDFVVNCCKGWDTELEQAKRALVDSAAIVVDASALCTLYLTGIFREFASLPRPTIVPQTVVDCFEAPLSDPHSRLWSKTNVYAENGRLVFHERSPTEIEEAKRTLEEFVNWIKGTLEVRSLSALAEMESARVESAVERFGEAAADVLRIAADETIPIWSDDLGLAEYAFETLEVRRCWTRLLAQECVDAERLNESELVKLELKLIGFRYQFTPLSPFTVKLALDECHWVPSKWPLSSIVEWIYVSSVLPVGAVKVAFNAISYTTANALLPHQKRDVARAFVRALGNRPDAREVLMHFRACVPRIFGYDVIGRDECLSFIATELDLNSVSRHIILPGDREWS